MLPCPPETLHRRCWRQPDRVAKSSPQAMGCARSAGVRVASQHSYLIQPLMLRWLDSQIRSRCETLSSRCFASQGKAWLGQSLFEINFRLFTRDLAPSQSISRLRKLIIDELTAIRRLSLLCPSWARTRVCWFFCFYLYSSWWPASLNRGASYSSSQSRGTSFYLFWTSINPSANLAQKQSHRGGGSANKSATSKNINTNTPTLCPTGKCHSQGRNPGPHTILQGDPIWNVE